MDLSKVTIGPFTLYTIEAGRFRLDGGAMFGVVPKALWSRQIEADEQNRIPMTMRCLLIESANTGRIYLVDNGAGDKFNDKFKKIYCIDYSEYNLIKSLNYHGFQPGDITDLILTHLHFDHCGGTIKYDDAGNLISQFPSAKHHITKKQWETANSPNEREKASFLKENIEPLNKVEDLNLVEPNHQYEKGISAIEVNGHTLGQQLPRIEANSTTLVFAGDLIPTHVHVPLPWVMGYDMRPVKTLEEKDNILSEAAENGWYLYLEHDAFEEVIRITKEGGKYRVRDTFNLSEIPE